jgi:hypothetical protein
MNRAIIQDRLVVFGKNAANGSAFGDQMKDNCP